MKSGAILWFFTGGAIIIAFIVAGVLAHWQYKYKRDAPKYSQDEGTERWRTRRMKVLWNVVVYGVFALLMLFASWIFQRPVGDFVRGSDEIAFWTMIATPFLWISIGWTIYVVYKRIYRFLLARYKFKKRHASDVQPGSHEALP